MDLKELYELVNSVNLNEIIYILQNKTITFPVNDSSDIIEFIENKNITTLQSYYQNIQIDTDIKHVKPPYIKNNNNAFIILLCFIKAYASNTYSHKGCFKEYFKDVFNVFYNPL